MKTVAIKYFKNKEVSMKQIFIKTSILALPLLVFANRAHADGCVVDYSSGYEIQSCGPRSASYDPYDYSQLSLGEGEAQSVTQTPDSPAPANNNDEAGIEEDSQLPPAIRTAMHTAWKISEAARKKNRDSAHAQVTELLETVVVVELKASTPGANSECPAGTKEYASFVKAQSKIMICPGWNKLSADALAQLLVLQAAQAATNDECKGLALEAEIVKASGGTPAAGLSQANCQAKPE